MTPADLLSSPSDPAWEGDEVAWAKPEYSRTKVEKAGKVLGNPDASPIDRAAALVVVKNWRAAHAYPLNTMQMHLRKTARRVDSDAVIAQRLKRMSSIEAKLIRRGAWGLNRMQDLGGCRAIVATIDHVAALRDALLQSKAAHILWRSDDYIWEEGPKSTGYRSLHLVYACQSGSRPEHNGLLIEVQLRSRLQHAWATAVETAGAFLGQPLKAGEGDADWLRFFVLMASEIAHREKAPPVAGVPESRTELRDEIRSLAGSLDVVKRLRAYQSAMSVTNSDVVRSQNVHYLLLVRDESPTGPGLSLFGFKAGDLNHATDMYATMEQSDPNADVVLVSMADMVTLTRAYPNYFADTTEFLRLVRNATDPRRDRIRRPRVAT